MVKQNRRNRTLQMLKQAIEARRFGRIYMVSINVFWTRPQSYYDGAKWRGTWEFDGGAFMNQASHYVDLLDWLVGPVESVMAYTGTLARRIEVEDTGVAALKWRNGAMGSISVTMLTYPKNLEGSITDPGRDRHGEDRRRGGERDSALGVSRRRTTMDRRSRRELRDDVGLWFGHPLYYDNVIGTLRGEAEAETDGREGLRSLELLIALYKSARDGRRVNLPLEY